MDFLSAFLLGILQGITEFLPVSSSGHLVIGQCLLGWKEPDVFFDVCLHIGTLIAVVAVFWQEVMDLAMGGLRVALRPFRRGKLMDSQERMFLLVVVGTIPTVILALFVRHYIEQMFASISAVSFNLIITGTFLWMTRYVPRREPRYVRRTRWRDALFVGIAQGLALSPGISRSGATISAGLYVGLDREWAGRFSFLLFVPAVFGALILESSKINFDAVQVRPVLLGTFTAAVVGYFALLVLLKVIRSGRFYLFAPYCWTLGLVGLAWDLFFRA